MGIVQPLSNTAPTATLNPRWEYMTMSYSYSYGSTTYEINGDKEGKLKNRPLHDVLTLFGQSGWELVGMGGPEGKTYVLKRQGMRDMSADRPDK